VLPVSSEDGYTREKTVITNHRPHAYACTYWYMIGERRLHRKNNILYRHEL